MSASMSRPSICRALRVHAQRREQADVAAPQSVLEARPRPHRASEPGRVDLQWNLNEQAAFELVKANQLDEGPIPAAEVQNVANAYGVNRSRFWVEPLDCIGEIAFNNSRGLFRNNAAMRGLSTGPSTVRTTSRGFVRPNSLDTPAAPRIPRLDHEAAAPAVCADGEARKGETDRGRSFQGRQGHRLLPLVGLDEPGSGPEGSTAP